MFRFTIRELVLTVILVMVCSDAAYAAPPIRQSSTVETTCGGIRFKMDLPATWGQWYEHSACADKDQSGFRGLIGIFRNTHLHIDHDEVCDDDSAATVARKRLAYLPGEVALNAKTEKGWKVTIHDQRIISVGGVDAVWQAISSEKVNELPWTLKMTCYVRWGGVDFIIQGRYDDNRSGRTAKDFDDARAEILSIIQSFRLVNGPATE